ncbi:hypothetical protein [Sphingomonas aracearum]|uniref:hypothetical protein n=1 Tax=Sphingomonas aracearum TaxID=2283317 RepID=UPI001EEFCEAE|nr:hypothetical protein [Sphingomonas aracearum]
MRARVDVTSGGVLAIGGLVAGVLLSTAVIVAIAEQGAAARRARRPGPPAVAG